MAKKRVLYIVNSLSRGSGVMSYIMNLYRNIDHKEIQIDFLVSSTYEISHEKEVIGAGSKVFYIAAPRKINLKNYKDYKSKLEKFYKEEKGNYEIVHSHVPTLNFLHFPIAKKAGFKYRIVHSHSTKSSGRLIGRLRNFFLLINLKNDANVFFACTKEAANYLYGKKFTENSNVYLVNNGIESENFEYSKELRKKLRTNLNIDDKFVIGHVGRFAKEKNHTFLLEIFMAMKKKRKDSVLLLIGDGELKATIQKQADSLGISDDVIFLGLRDDVNDLMQAMDIFILPSIFEGLGIVVIEAQASGLPCLVSKNVPSDVDITSLVKHLSLKRSPKIWASEALELSMNNINRKSRISEIKNKNYDVKNLSKWVENYYRELQ